MIQHHNSFLPDLIEVLVSSEQHQFYNVGHVKYDSQEP